MREVWLSRWGLVSRWVERVLQLVVASLFTLPQKICKLVSVPLSTSCSALTSLISADKSNEIWLWSGKAICQSQCQGLPVNVVSRRKHPLASLGIPKLSQSIPTTHLFFPCNAGSISILVVLRLHLQHSSEELFRCLSKEANLGIRVEAIQVGRLRGQLSIDILKSRARSARVTNLSPICKVLCGTQRQHPGGGPQHTSPTRYSFP